jgi:hypothetical protein
LCSVADNLEDVNCETVGRIVKLLVEALAHVLPLDWLMDKRRDDGLGVPVREAVHDSGKFFIRVDGTLASIFVLEGSIGVDCGLCRESQWSMDALGRGTYSAVSLDSSFGMQQEAYHKEEIVQQPHAWHPLNGSCRSEIGHREFRP